MTQSWGNSSAYRGLSVYQDCFASLAMRGWNACAMTLLWTFCHCEEREAMKQFQLTSIEQENCC